MTPRPADTPRRFHKHAKSQVDGSLKTDSTQAESKRSRPLAQQLTLRGEVLGHHAALQPIKRSEAELREIYGEPVVTLEDCDTGKSLSMPLSEYAKRPECLQNQKKWLAREMLREIYDEARPCKVWTLCLVGLSFAPPQILARTVLACSA